jgi:ribosomal protein L11 methyltransferase
MMGAGRAIGVDVDPLALEAARYNSRRNQVRLDARDANGELPTDADITVANILANPLRMLAPLLATHTRTGGLLALSESSRSRPRPWPRRTPPG